MNRSHDNRLSMVIRSGNSTEAEDKLADAAPELLSMLSRLLDGVLRLPDLPATICNLDIEQARTAIAKAEVVALPPDSHPGWDKLASDIEHAERFDGQS